MEKRCEERLWKAHRFTLYSFNILFLFEFFSSFFFAYFSFYQGKNDVRNGVGRLTGLRIEYRGDWKDDKRSGFGIQHWSRGKMVEYQGEWVNGKRKGWGRAKYRDGERFEGQWRAGGREGLGISIYPDGSVYEGEWKNDEKHGQGRFISALGTIQDGEWRNNIAVRSTILIKKDIQQDLKDPLCT
ncbi:MORN repeat-containing protein 3 isoform X2 [Eurytemora carolleeae]|uniref:MORN repeat-containing protein 3 isoform X2 n=1 Tax=Eurytemora carolleeae TaxID=1294199 RepID=UPI000C78428F|nr:MORN repeat-containing protein 3 isoform X2 [Eurytemora carolleeae]|eukprot:XP_023332546.1 MORN repeat-containing protein 3-like isoform X2 [Eurytemora affinis]